MKTIGHCLPTTIGSMPHTSAREACDLLLRFTPEIPAWPQLPERTPLENMYAQYTELLPGAEVVAGKVQVDLGEAFQRDLERLYFDYVEGNVDRYLPSPERAAGLHATLDLLKTSGRQPLAAKGQITGPISLGLQVTDGNLKPLLYDDIAFDAVSKYLRLVARAMEKALGQVGRMSVIFLDEPYLHALGSALFSISRDQVVGGLEEVFGGVSCLKGIHCCGNTDWPVVLSTSLDILSFDAYRYAETLALYPGDLKRFLQRGGILAWGIVPADALLLQNENVPSLTAKLLDAMQLLAGKGVSREMLLNQCLITPSCGLGSLPIPAAERALGLLAGVSREMRARFFNGGEQ
ncbi:MAG: methionine synthase [Chloroflexi bacterium]|nr:methionine synthase [Chloroflexota bacterium]